MLARQSSTFRELLDLNIEDLPGLDLRPVTVAVLDSGIDATHPALKGRIVKASSLGKDGRGIVATRLLNKKANNDLCGHGTGVAGIVAAIAPNAAMEDVRVLGCDCSGYGDVVLDGLESAIKGKAEIINISIAFAKDRYWARTAKLLEKAYIMGKIVVASKRNIPLPGDLGIPAELPTAISVDAAAFANPFILRYFRKSRIEFAAQGENVKVPRSGGGWTRVTGSSVATPVVAAFCALLRGLNRDIALFEIKSILKHHADRCFGKCKT